MSDGQQDASFLPPLGNFCNFYCCFIFVDKERSPEIFVEPNLFDILENSIFSCTHNFPFDCDNKKNEISSQVFYHVIP